MQGGFITRDEMLAVPAVETSDPTQLVSDPMVSVVTITYNHELFIEETIQGVIAQKCAFPIELIIGEDKSTDKTLEICLRYQRKYPAIIRVITSDENVGVNLNFFRVLGRARGKYIALCEGDDYWIDPAKLSKQVALMESSSSTVLCGAKVIAMSAMRKIEYGPEKQQEKYSLLDVLNSGGLFHTSTYLIRASAMVTPKQVYTIEYLDYFLQAVLATQGHLKCLSDITSVYREHPGGISSGRPLTAHYERNIAVYQSLLEVLDDRYVSLLNNRITLLSSILAHQYAKEGNLAEARKQSRAIFGRLAIADPLRAFLLAVHLFMPNIYDGVKRVRYRGK
jgi:glycosyltransferase involved in cell wall biosynthesis